MALGTPSRRYFAAVPRHWMAFVSFGLFAALTTMAVVIPRVAAKKCPVAKTIPVFPIMLRDSPR